MKAEKKQKDDFDVVITMSKKDAEILKNSIGKKSKEDFTKFFDNNDMAFRLEDLYNAIDRILG